MLGKSQGPCLEEPEFLSCGSRRKSDRGSTLQFWALWVWLAWLVWKLDLCDDVVKQNPMISIFRKFRSLKSDRGSSPLRPPLDLPLFLTLGYATVRYHQGRREYSKSSGHIHSRGIFTCRKGRLSILKKSTVYAKLSTC